MKRVSFKVAKVLKEAGYPQSYFRYQYNFNGDLIDLISSGGICYGPVAPTYLEVWLWLWREKKIFLSPRIIQKDETLGNYTWLISPWDMGYVTKYVYRFNDSNERNPYKVMDDCNDQEEAIINAIEYLCDNNLIK